jgi:urease accessory protein
VRAILIKQASTWTGEPADRILLDYEGRHRRRVKITGIKGTAFLLDLPAGASLYDGDALVLEDGRLIEVVAASEPLLEIRCSDAKHLARVAWHLGNRHLPAEMLNMAVRIRRDHVIVAMAVGLGAQVIEVDAPFDPEGGAHQASRVHGHEHAHKHG